MTPAATGQQARSDALAVLRSAGTHPIVRCFPQGALIVFDADLRYLSAGGLGLGDVGLSREMLEGNTIFEVFAPEVVAAIEPLYRRALAGDESAVDVPYQGRIYLQRLGPLRAADGSIVAGMGFTQDVTAARRHERELRESEQRFRLAFQHAPIAKAVIGLDGRYEMVNPAMCAFTGYSEAELVGRTMADVSHPDDLAADLAAMTAAQAGGQESYTMDKRYRTATAGTVWGAQSATLVRREDGSALHFIAQILDITARKRSEQALLDERRRLRDAESIGRIGSWELDVASDEIFWSAGMFELWGIDPNGFDGAYDSARQQIHPADLPALDAAVDACVTAGTPFCIRYRITRADDNSNRWIEARGAAFRDDGRIVRIGGALADITDQVAADADAAAAAAFQQAVFTASPDIIAVWDFASASITWANHSITGLLGYSDEDLAGIDSVRTHLVYEPDLAHFDAVMSAAQNAVTDEVISVDYRMVCKDGSLRWFSRRTAPVERDEAGRVTKIVGVIRDTTAEKASEAALQESEARFRQLADNVHVGFILRNLEPPAVLYVSPGYQKIIGFDPMAADDPLAAIGRIVHPDDTERVRTDYLARIGLGLPAESEFRIVRSDGAVRWVHSSSTPVVDPDGVVRRTASTGDDVTDRKLAEAARLSAENLARATKLKSEFLSRASHELRTPLNAILGFGQLLALEDLTADQRDAVEHIMRGGRHLVTLVDDILDITGMHRDDLELTIEDIDPDGLLGTCAQLMTPLADGRDVHLQYRRGAAGGVLVRADPRRLTRVITNLLSNAIMFNRPGGRVDLSYAVSQTAPRLDITVTDTGRGIATHDLPRLFLPFDRIDAEANHIVGTGLGLTLSRDLMTTMGGTLQASSQEGVGSIFTASIPLASTDGDRQRSTAVHTRRGGSAAKTVLYIEDTSANVGLLEQILARRPNVTLRVAMLGRIGLEMALQDPPDLILLDLHLPDISGQEVLQRLRADSRTAATPIVIVSADATPGQPQRLAALGATSYQTKPVKVSRLLELVDRLDVGAQLSAAPSSPQVVPGSGPSPDATEHPGGSADDDAAAAAVSNFRHDMINLLSVVLSYSDLLARDETQPAKITWLEKQGAATEQAIELTQELRVPAPP